MTFSTRSRHTSRSLGLIVLCAVLVFGATGCNGNESAMRSQTLVNSERQRIGAPQLAWNDNAGAKAQAWAEHMAATRKIAHSSLTQGITGDWRTLAENVGFASSVDRVHQLFLQSSGHAANIRGRRFTSVGIGVAERDGVFYVAQVFRG